MYKKWIQQKEQALKIEKMKDEIFLFFSKNYLLKDEKDKEKILDETFFQLRDKYTNTNFFKHNFPILEGYKLFWIDGLAGKNDYSLNLKETTLPLCFNYDKEVKNNWNEIFLLHKLCATYNYNLLKTIFKNIISLFYTSNSKKRNLTKNKEVKATIIFTDKPDIRIILNDGKKLTEIGIEITEVFSLSSSKGSVYKLVNREVERAEREGKIEKVVERLKGKGLKKILSLDIEKEKEDTHVKVNFTKKAGISELMKNLLKQIKKKNKKRKEYKVDKIVLWITLSAEFLIYLYREKEHRHSLMENEDIQKDFLSYHLIKEIFEYLTSNDIEIEFEHLLITFLNRHYSTKEDFLNDYDPFFKNYKENFKRLLGEKSWFYNQFNKEDIKVIIPHLYIPVIGKKIKNLKKELEKREKKFLKDWKFNINSLEYSEANWTHESFTQTEIDLSSK
ncbi:hypothetical protein GvMRE_I1g393 [endosymbiont GvMRE of Glomus versiforme]|nr:hypothetical protein GvMRE_I1g393 [endosymbiont GvMRE of Glomus versiforme]